MTTTTGSDTDHDGVTPNPSSDVPEGRRRTPGSGGNKKGRRASFGSIRKLPSGRFQARYTGPDGLTHRAPTTFDTKGDAEAWLSLRRSEITLAKWRPPAPDDSVTFGAYAEKWIEGRQVRGRPLKARTRQHYQSLLSRHLAPTFGARR